MIADENRKRRRPIGRQQQQRCLNEEEYPFHNEEEDGLERDKACAGSLDSSM